MTNPEFHQCPDCGYKWRHGQHGGHSCKNRLIKQRDELLAALKDMHGGWRYIRSSYGDLYGVGWDRCEESASKAIANAEGNHEQP